MLDCDVTGLVNIATDWDISLGQVAASVGRTLDWEELVDIIKERGNPGLVATDVACLRDDMGFAPAMSTEAGLERTIQWWKQRDSATP